VAETLDKEEHTEKQSATLHRASSRAPAIVISLTFLSLGLLSAATAYALSFNRIIEQPPRETASAPIPDPIISATLKNIQLAQQQNAAVLESLAQSSAVQRTDLKRISDQLSSLAARADALQDAPLTTSAIPQSNDRARAVTTSRKKTSLLPKPISQLPKPMGPFSVGGAPLSPAPVPELRAE
jgi:hypothetical protein